LGKWGLNQGELHPSLLPVDMIFVLPKAIQISSTLK